MPMMFPIQTKMFQSTYLYKVRRTLSISLKYVTGFNPRTYIRYDANQLIALGVLTVSIHVPI